MSNVQYRISSQFHVPHYYCHSLSWWRHDAEMLTVLLAFVRGTQRSLVKSLLKYGALTFSRMNSSSPQSIHYSIHYRNIIMGAMASQITSLTIVYSTIHSSSDQTKHQSSAPLAFVRGIHRWPVNSPHKWPVTRKMFPSDDVILRNSHSHIHHPIRSYHPLWPLDSTIDRKMQQI